MALASALTHQALQNYFHESFLYIVPTEEEEEKKKRKRENKK